MVSIQSHDIVCEQLTKYGAQTHDHTVKGRALFLTELIRWLTSWFYKNYNNSLYAYTTEELVYNLPFQPLRCHHTGKRAATAMPTLTEPLVSPLPGGASKECHLAWRSREVVHRHDIWVQILWHLACRAKKRCRVDDMRHFGDMSASNATKHINSIAVCPLIVSISAWAHDNHDNHPWTHTDMTVATYVGTPTSFLHLLASTRAEM